MRFSVIIPVYNNKEWLPKCFDSILNQTFTDYEVIIVDDMSTDGNIEVIKEYVKKFKDRCKGVKFIKNKSKRLNGGTRNVGIVEAKGEYTISIDCDDWLIDDNVFKNINDKLDGEDIMFLGYLGYTGNNNFKCIPIYKDLEEALRGKAFALWTRVVKTDLLKQVLFKEGTLFEDVGQHYRLIEKCNTFSCLGQITHIWNRTSTNNISSRKDWVWYRFNFCGEMYELIRNTTNPERKEFYLDVLKQYMLSLNDMVNSL